jgi:hypothetical protein
MVNLFLFANNNQSSFAPCILHVMEYFLASVDRSDENVEENV